MTEQDLQHQVQQFTRAFGLLTPNQTPCGHPVSLSQAHALQALHRSEPLTQQDLADRLHLDKSTASRLVSLLVDRGWTVRSVNPGDRRKVHLTLTERGREMAEQVSHDALARYRTLWDQIPEAKRTQVLEALALLTAAVKEHAHDS